MTLDVDYKVSLHESKTAGRWNINKDKGAITLNLPILYDHSEKIIKKQWQDNPKSLSAIWCVEDDIIELFILNLIETEVIERVCIERAYQKIKLKGGRCKPHCRVEKTAMFMCYPDEWDIVKNMYNNTVGIKND